MFCRISAHRSLCVTDYSAWNRGPLEFLLFDGYIKPCKTCSRFVAFLRFAENCSLAKQRAKL